tara:strand:- start:335 stop:571 length:237 start_codon:yes stop_codon:yes gene_type:complete
MDILNSIYYAFKLRIREIKDKNQRKIAHSLNKQGNYICVTSTSISQMSVKELKTLIDLLEMADELAKSRLSKLLSVTE